MKNQVKKNNSESLEKTGLTKCKQRESFAKQLAKRVEKPGLGDKVC